VEAFLQLLSSKQDGKLDTLILYVASVDRGPALILGHHVYISLLCIIYDSFLKEFRLFSRDRYICQLINETLDEVGYGLPPSALRISSDESTV
jgi:hypothetical protein